MVGLLERRREAPRWSEVRKSGIAGLAAEKGRWGRPYGEYKQPAPESAGKNASLGVMKRKRHVLHLVTGGSTFTK
jgi:hypothetical protein